MWEPRTVKPTLKYERASTVRWLFEFPALWSNAAPLLLIDYCQILFSFCLIAIESRQTLKCVEQKYITQTKDKLDKYYCYSSPLTSMIKKCYLNFVMIWQARLTPNVLDAQLRSQQPKQLNQFIILYCWPSGNWKFASSWKP